MKKQIKKLQLNRDTLTNLVNDQEKDLRNVQGAAQPNTGQSVCWCYT